MSFLTNIIKNYINHKNNCSYFFTIIYNAKDVSQNSEEPHNHPENTDFCKNVTTFSEIFFKIS